MLGLKILLQKIQKSNNVKNEDFKKIRSKMNELEENNNLNNEKVEELLLDFVEFCIDNNKIKTKYAEETILFIFRKFDFIKIEENIRNLLENATFLKRKYLKTDALQEEFIENNFNFLKSKYPNFGKYLALKNEFFNIKEKKIEEKDKELKTLKTFNIKFWNALKKFENYYYDVLYIPDLSEIEKRTANVNEIALEKLTRRFTNKIIAEFYDLNEIQKIMKRITDPKTLEQKCFEKTFEEFFWWYKIYEYDVLDNDSVFKAIKMKEDSFFTSSYSIEKFLKVLIPIVSKYYYDLSEDERKNYKNYKFNFKKSINKKVLEFLIYLLRYANNFDKIKEKVFEAIELYYIESSKKNFLTSIVKKLDLTDLIKLLTYIKDNYAK